MDGRLTHVRPIADRSGLANGELAQFRPAKPPRPEKLYACARAGQHNAIIMARFYDTTLGCVVGMAGAICLHNQRFRDALSRPLKRLVSARLRP